MTNATIKQAQSYVATEIFANMSSHIGFLMQSGVLEEELQPLFNAVDWELAVEEFDYNHDGEYRIVQHDDGKVSIEDCTDGGYIYQWYDDPRSMVQEFYNDGYGDRSDIEVEPLEFWLVSAWLHGKLEDHDEPVAIINGLHIWGRCTTGQAIKMDWVMQAIAQEQIEKYGC